MGRHCLSGIGRGTLGGSVRGVNDLTNRMYTGSFMCGDSIERSDIDFALCLCPTVPSFSPFSFFLSPIFPPFFLSSSSHYRRRGQLHGLTGVSGGQRGPPHHPHQRFRHQPKVSSVPSVPSAFRPSLFPPGMRDVLLSAGEK